jgi:hypothetical protein
MVNWFGAAFWSLIMLGILISRLGYRMTSRYLVTGDKPRGYLVFAGLVELMGFCLVCVGIGGVAQ